MTASTTAGTAAPYRIGMVVFEQMTLLDFAAPQDAFARLQGATVHVIGKSLAPLATDSAIRVTPDTTLESAPDLDLLFIGGGSGVNALMEDEVMLDFLRQRAARAQWITSVCTGALVLGAAGLLRGYRAATHWAYMEALPILGAEPVHERVVIDRNRITGGGVTAGLDFGLVVVAKLFGERTAQLIQLGEEYNPAPPYDAGSPDKAPPDVVTQLRGALAGNLAARLAIARRAAAKFR